MVHDYSIILIQNKPEIRLTIPFKSSPKQANCVFSQMAFSFNCSPFDKIYLYEHIHDDGLYHYECNSVISRSVMLNVAYLKGVYK